MNGSAQPIAELSSRLSFAEFQDVFYHSPIPQAVLLADELFTIVAVNREYENISGAAQSDVTGRGFFESFPDEPSDGAALGANQLRASFCRAVENKTADQLNAQRYDLKRHGSQESFWNFVNTPLSDMNGSVQHLLVSLTEATAVVQADREIREAVRKQQSRERHFQQLAEAGGFGVMITDTKRRITYANQALLQLLGYSQDDVNAGLLRWDEFTPPEYSALDELARQQVINTGKCAPYEKAYITKSGRRVPVMVGATRLDSADRPPEAAAFVVDLTERKQSERDALLISLEQSIRQLDDPHEIVTAALGLLSEFLKTERATCLLVGDDRVSFSTPVEYRRTEVLPLHPHLRLLAQFGPEFVRCMHSKLPFVRKGGTVIDSAGDEQVMDRALYSSLIAVPVYKGDTLAAVLSVMQDAPRDWLPEEVELVRIVANRCWESVERAQVTRSLQHSEQRLRLAQRAARIGTYEVFLQENRVVWTPEAEALFEVPEGTFKGGFDDWSERVVPEDAAIVKSVVDAAFAARHPECEFEFRVKLPQGELRWLRSRALLFYNAAGVPERLVGVNIDIDRYKRAEAHLKNSEERMRAIFDGTFEYIGLLDRNGTVLEANRASLNFAYEKPTDMIGQPFWEISWFRSTPGAPQAVRKAIQRAATGEFVRFEATLSRPTGEQLTFDISLHPTLNEAGEVILIVPEARNITERKRAEEQLRQQWHTFDTALSNTPDITYTFDTEGRFTYANRQLLIASQRPLKDTVGKTVQDLGYPQELANRIRNQIRTVVETKQTVRDETPFRLPTGEWREYEYIYVPVLAEDGSVRAIAGASRDITERISAERRVKESENRVRQIIDSMPQLVWSTSADSRQNIYNQKWFDYTGLTLEQSINQGWHAVHPDDLPQAVEKWAHSLHSGDPYETEYRCRRFDGEYRWFLARACSIRDESGAVVRWFGTCTDIQDQKAAEQELRRAHRELEEFAYVASHDLQEPLRMVNIYAHLILKQLPATEGSSRGPLTQYAAFVRQGVTRMETLLRDLLSFSRAVHTEAAPVGSADLGASLSEALSVLSHSIDDCGAIIHSGALPLVRGDTDQLAHVFQNLISNALKYRKKDVRPEISIESAQIGNEWKVTVRDNGIGFAPQYAERIFGLFKRLHKDEYAGTGLGLAICKRIVERYQGRMWAESELDQGATFHFILPGLDGPPPSET